MCVEAEESKQLHLAQVIEQSLAFEETRGILVSGTVLELGCSTWRLRVSQLEKSGSGCLTCYCLQVQLTQALPRTLLGAQQS